MKTFPAVSAVLALAASSQVVVAQDWGGVHDGLLPLTTLPLTNQAGATTGSETLYATAITTSTAADGSVTTVYSDSSGIVTPTATGAAPVSTSSAVATGAPVVSTSVAWVTTTSGLATTVIASATSTSTSVEVSVITGTASTLSTSAAASSKAWSSTGSASKTASSTSKITSSAAIVSPTGISSADRTVVGGLGLVGAAVAGLMVL